jgi:hypothetical protein
MQREYIMTLKEFLNKYPSNNKKDRIAMIYFGWYDWFCQENELSKRLDKMYPVIKKVVNILDLEQDKYTFYLKNVCPCLGPTFDRIGFNHIDLDEQIFIIDFPSLEAKPNQLYCHTTYDFFSSLDDFYEPVVKEKDLSSFYDKVLIHKNKLLLPLLMK